MHKSLVVLGVALVAAACRDVPPTSPAAERAVIATQRQHLVLPVTDNGDGTATIVFQPSRGRNNGTDEGGLTTGKDAYVREFGATDYSSGVIPWHMHFNSDCNGHHSYSLYRLDVTDLPDPSLVVSARVELFHMLFNHNSIGWPTPTTTFAVFPVLSPWNELTVKWATRPMLAAAFSSVTLAMTTPIPLYETAVAWYEDWASVDVTGLYAAWKNNPESNHGFAYQRMNQFCEASTATWTYTASSDMQDGLPGWLPSSATWRPKLVVTYVVNHAPTVAINPLPDAPVGAAVTIAANAADEDGDALSYAWTVDGVAAGAAESITYTFATAGTHTVSVTVSDGKVRGTATATANVTVLTAVEWIDAMRNTLDVAGLEKGLTNSLGKKLDNAATSLAKGNTNAALGQLGAFQNELEAALKTGRVPEPLGTQLLQMLTQLLATL